MSGSETPSEQRTIPALLQTAARRFGSRTPVCYPRGQRSCLEQLDATARLAGVLTANGIARG
jgi:hypothetical protein